MSCFGIDIKIRRKLEVRVSRKRGTKSDPEGFPRRATPGRTSRPGPGSMSHPGYGDSTSKSSTFLVESERRELRAFTFLELKLATKSFSLNNQIGEGGFGNVYKGIIKQKSKLLGTEEKIEVAVKQLNNGGPQGHREWITEVHFLGIVDNPFLVKLIGYCADEDERGIQRLLVYEYMPNKGLDDHIFRTVPPVLSWQARVKIALGAARGLAYLHNEKGVIFRDFKAANVLLDEEFNPKLSDFGLARQGPDVGKTHVTTGLKGTYGYAAPEYIQTGHLTFKSDVFSFGVVLMEMLTGRRALDNNRPKTEQRMLEWVKPFINDPRKFHLAMDPRLELQYPTKAAIKFATIGLQCLEKQPKARLKMVDVVEGLKKVLEMTYLWESPKISTPTTPHTGQAATASENNSSNGNRSPKLPRQKGETGETPNLSAPQSKSPRRSTNLPESPSRTASERTPTPAYRSTASSLMKHTNLMDRPKFPLNSPHEQRKRTAGAPDNPLPLDALKPQSISCKPDVAIDNLRSVRTVVLNRRLESLK